LKKNGKIKIRKLIAGKEECQKKINRIPYALDDSGIKNLMDTEIQTFSAD